MLRAGVVENTFDFRNVTLCPLLIRCFGELHINQTHISICAKAARLAHTLAMVAIRMRVPANTKVSSLTTYNSCEMAVARSPVPKTTLPVFVMRLGEEGRFSMISEARCSGGGFDPLAIVRLHGRCKIEHIVLECYLKTYAMTARGKPATACGRAVNRILRSIMCFWNYRAIDIRLTRRS